jgi:predicted dehydrogenase
MRKCEYAEVVAVASRDRARAIDAARRLDIPRSYGSYEELLADSDIEAVYIPLPNHLHAPWALKAATAGKHVLCEKPLATSVAEVRMLLDARQRTGVKIGEAFMVRSHPRWLRARELVRGGRIGQMRAVSGIFTFFNRDARNIRNSPHSGGGALLDVGCYPVTLSRFLYAEEPQRVLGLVERDPEFGVDRLVSALLEFPSGQCAFTCSTQLSYLQRMQLVGTGGRIEIESALNPPIDQPTRILIEDGPDSTGAGTSLETIPRCDQFTIQGDLFSRAIREGADVPVPLEDSLQNMAVLEALLRSAVTGAWERPTAGAVAP